MEEGRKDAEKQCAGNVHAQAEQETGNDLFLWQRMIAFPVQIQLLFLFEDQRDEEKSEEHAQDGKNITEIVYFVIVKKQCVRIYEKNQKEYRDNDWNQQIKKHASAGDLKSFFRCIVHEKASCLFC